MESTFDQDESAIEVLDASVSPSPSAAAPQSHESMISATSISGIMPNPLVSFNWGPTNQDSLRRLVTQEPEVENDKETLDELDHM